METDAPYLATRPDGLQVEIHRRPITAYGDNRDEYRWSLRDVECEIRALGGPCASGALALAAAMAWPDRALVEEVSGGVVDQPPSTIGEFMSRPTSWVPPSARPAPLPYRTPRITLSDVPPGTPEEDVRAGLIAQLAADGIVVGRLGPAGYDEAAGSWTFEVVR